MPLAAASLVWAGQVNDGWERALRGWAQRGQAAVPGDLAQHCWSWDSVSWDGEQDTALTLSTVQRVLVTIAVPGEGSDTSPQPHLKSSCVGANTRSTRACVHVLLFM